jgi:ferredoxin-NADP reductase
MSTPLLADDYLKLVNPLWSARELRGRIVEVRPETRDSATLVIKPGWGFSFDHQPGQYIGIGVLVDGRWRWRSYSLTSPARTGAARTLSITVKAMPEGFLSTHLVTGVQPGTVVRLAAPQGDFVMPDPPPASVLFLTAGSGITPVMSMLRTMARRRQIGSSPSPASRHKRPATRRVSEPFVSAREGRGGREGREGRDGREGREGTDIVHLHSAPTADDVMFAAELAELERTEPSYRLTVRATHVEGRLDLSRLADQVPDWRDRQTWVCGPEGLLAEAERIWSASGLADRLHLERFAATRLAAVDGGGTVTFARSGTVRAADAATSLLEAGELAGVQLPFGCRMGICHTCVVSLVDGRVRDLRTGVEYEPGTRVQTCVTAPSGDCVVDC